MPARVKPSFLARAKRFLCARRRGGAKFQRLPPSVMVIGVQPFEVWRASNVLHSSLRAHHQPAASFFLSLPSPFSLFFFPFLVTGCHDIIRARARRKRNFKIPQEGRGGFRIAREITALDNAFACQLARGWGGRGRPRSN